MMLDGDVARAVRVAADNVAGAANVRDDLVVVDDIAASAIVLG